MRRIALCAALLAAALVVVAPFATRARAQEKSTTNVRREIADLLAAVVSSINKGDMTSLSELVSTKQGFVAIANGQIVRGHDALLKNAGLLVGNQGKYTIALGQLDINTIKGGVVVATGPYTIQVKGKKGSVTGKGAVTFVLEKQDKFWRVAHINRSLYSAAAN